MKVLIVDDHWMIRASLKHAIEKLDATLESLEAGSFKEASDALQNNPDIDLMLIDLVMPGYSDLDGLRSLRANYPDIPIVVISVHEDREHVLEAISQGVIGYIPKSAEGAELLHALTLVLNGGVYFPRDILQGSRSSRRQSALPEINEGMPVETSSVLTAREEQILDLVALGRSNVDIADALGLSPNTVRVHLRNAGLKLNIKDRSGFVEYKAARQHT